MKLTGQTRYALAGVILVPIVVWAAALLAGIAGHAEVSARVARFLITVGAITLILNLLWYLSYQRRVYANRVILERRLAYQCPVCRNTLRLETKKLPRTLGIPRLRARLVCTDCKTSIEARSPFRRWDMAHLDRRRNAEIHYMYQGERLTKSQLRSVTAGKHTRKALQKRHSRLMREIATGHLERLGEVEPDFVWRSTWFKVHLGQPPSQYLGLPIKPGEALLVTFRDVKYARRRTRGNRPYLRVLEKGTFFITDQRYGLKGESSDYSQELSVVSSLSVKKDQIAIGRDNWVWPDVFLHLDGDLVAAILKGLV